MFSPQNVSAGLRIQDSDLQLQAKNHKNISVAANRQLWS